jgi:hypothetical protein
MAWRGLEAVKIPPATEPIAVAARPVEAERRQLTVLFWDLLEASPNR